MTVVIEQTVIDAMNDRKSKVAQIIADAKKDPTINDSKTIQLFLLMDNAVDNYKYTGDNTAIKKIMDDEIETNWNWLKDFLLWLSYLEIQIYELILARLN